MESSVNVVFGADDEYQQGPYKGQSKQFIARGIVTGKQIGRAHV